MSLPELATNLAINRETVDRYLDLLEKVFVIFRVRDFYQNLQKEMTNNASYYFFDNGVRNVLIQNFNPLHLQNNVGQLWENYFSNGRRKVNVNLIRTANTYFWRIMTKKKLTILRNKEVSCLYMDLSGRVK